MTPAILTLHILASTIWVGGMFFAHMALRPAAAELLEPARRLPLLVAVFRRFFPWVWLAVVTLLLSGGWMMNLLGSAGLHWSTHAMAGIGVVMMALFAFVYFVPFRHMRREVARDDFRAAGRHMARIRVIILVNLTLGLTTIVLASAF